MKQCPACKNTYPDVSLQFCLECGTALSFYPTEKATEQFSGGANPIRVSLEHEETPTIVAQKPISPPPEQVKTRGWNLIYGLIIGFVVSAILAAVMFAGMFWWSNWGNNQMASNINPTPTKETTGNSLTQSPTPDETANLKQKIANLEKKVQEQKTTKPTVPTVSNVPSTSNRITAKANSPGDGFLALRSGPSAETGERILQIPHGATLTVLECLPRAAGKKGRWCRVDYNGNLGWAYDGFIIYQ